MRKSSTRLFAAAAVTGLVVLSACGSDSNDADDASDSTEAPAATEAPASTDDMDEGDMDEEGHSTDLASVCPAEIVIQTVKVVSKAAATEVDWAFPVIIGNDIEHHHPVLVNYISLEFDIDVGYNKIGVLFGHNTVSQYGLFVYRDPNYL